jgi:YegS/Rv2252/BmrU family lipid kinase
MSRAAIVVNPTKLDDRDAFRKSVCRAMDAHGWDEPVWRETTAEDPGRGQAEAAVSAGVDLVIACGGDGTVTACAEGVAGTGMPLAVIPLGTGNLLARNLDVPMDLEEALEVALGAAQRPIDAGRVNGSLFVVMAGLGLDARMLDDTSEPMKKRFGWAAYVLTAIRHLADDPFTVAIAADGGRRRRFLASAVVIGNVGWLQGGVPLLPDARPDDGKLDAVVLRAGGPAGWLSVAADILLRRREPGGTHRIRFSKLEVTLGSKQPWELDGEVVGSTRRLTVAAEPGALLLRVPPESD